MTLHSLESISSKLAPLLFLMNYFKQVTFNRSLIAKQQNYLKLRIIYNVFIQLEKQIFHLIDIILLLMFFFPEQSRKTDFQIVNTPSPAQYQPYHKSKIQTGYAPFNTTSKLNRNLKKQQPKHQHEALKDQEKTLLADEVRMKLLEQAKTSYMFNSKSSRFMKQQQQQNPGPGSYELRGKPHKKIKKFKQISKSQTLLSQSRIANTGVVNVPSIPCDNLGYKQDENNHIQKVVLENQGIIGPGTYQVGKNLVKSQGIRWQNTLTHCNKEDSITPGPGSYNLMQKSKSQPKFSSAFSSASDRFGALKRVRKEYLPGPGEYNIHENIKINRSISDRHFNSKAPRFKNVNQKNPDPTTYFAKKDPNSLNPGKNKNIVSFNSTSKQTTVFDHNNKTPGPGAYKDIYAIDHQLEKMLMRKYVDHVFNNQQRIVFNTHKFDQEEPLPGPGAYNVQKPKLNKYVQVVNLKEDESQTTPAPGDTYFKNFTIQNKINQETNKLTLTERKPFNSGSQRFKHYTKSKEKLSTKMSDSRQTGNPEMAEFGSTNKKIKKLVMTTVKVKVPFGMSSSKYQQRDKNMPGPGSYILDGKWSKKSFNIKGKLQESRNK